MKAPAPRAIRLVTRVPAARPPRPPFGLGAWSAEADAVGVLLDASPDEIDVLATIADQIPDASTLPPGTPVVVLDAVTRRGPTWQRLFGRALRASRAVRCTALLARGYVEIGAAHDKASGADLTWGLAPTP